MSAIIEHDVILEINKYLDAENCRANIDELGELLWTTFGSEHGAVSNQVRNLEQVVNSATRFGEIEVFIKSQMGKDSRGAEKWRTVGRPLLDAIGILHSEAKTICGHDAGNSLLQVRLRLARLWTRAVVAQYLYQKACQEIDRKLKDEVASKQN